MIINTDTIIKDNNPLIREKSVDVPIPLSKEDKELVLDMLNYVKESTDEKIAEEKHLQPAVGISAIQVGIKKKLTAIFIKNEKNEVIYEFAWANAKIISNSIEKTYLKGGEGCLSVPKNHEGYVNRSARIKVKAYDVLQEKEVLIEAEGYIAVVIQHELDHFKGILYYDYINKKNPVFELPGSIPIE